MQDDPVAQNKGGWAPPRRDGSARLAYLRSLPAPCKSASESAQFFNKLLMETSTSEIRQNLFSRTF